MASFRQKNKKWEARIVRRGMDSLSKTFATKDEAEIWARKVEHDIDLGKTIKRSSKSTVAAAIDAYLAENPKLGIDKKSKLIICRHDLGAYQLDKLTNTLINRYLEKLALTPVPPAHNKKPNTKSRRVEKNYSASTIRKVYFALRDCLIWHAKAKNHALKDDLFKDISVPSSWAAPRDRRLIEGEEERLLEAAAKREARAQTWPLLIRFAIETGMRQQELALARWTDLSPDGKGLHIPKENNKQDVARDVPLGQASRRIVEELRAICPAGNQFLFAEFNGDAHTISTGYRKLTKAAGITNLTFHDLRHEALTRLASKGVLSISELMEISGHTQLTTFQRYLRFFPNKLADKLDSAL